MSTVTTTAIGVGLDTARYGHHASFLREDLQLAAKPLQFAEGHAGYQSLAKVLAELAQKHPGVHFHIRVDAAGQYATNLLSFLHSLPWPKTTSVGEPARNQMYRQVHFPKRKADATESLACARYAIVERPAGTTPVPSELSHLQKVASELEFQVKESTRHVNHLHSLLAGVFPELAELQQDLTARWVLDLLEKYPTPELIGRARLKSLQAIPYLLEEKASRIHSAAKQSVASMRGPVAEELVRDAIQRLRQAFDAEARLEKMLVSVYRQVPDPRVQQLITIPGIGKRTAAVLVAKIVCIERFPSADHLASYFGVFPEENSSGVDRDGQPRPSGKKRMSRKGNDLARKHLWMAAFSGTTHNPHIRELYARLRGQGKRGDVSLGRCMCKLVHLVFGIWTSGKPYDPNHRRGTAEIDLASAQNTTEPAREATADSQPADREEKAVAGRKTGIHPDRQAVTATADIMAQPCPPQQSPSAGTEAVAEQSAPAPADADGAKAQPQEQKAAARRAEATASVRPKKQAIAGSRTSQPTTTAASDDSVAQPSSTEESAPADADGAKAKPQEQKAAVCAAENSGRPKKQASHGSRTSPRKLVAASTGSADESSSAEESEPADATKAKPQAVRPKKQAIASSRTSQPTTTAASDDSVGRSSSTEESACAEADGAKPQAQKAAVCEAEDSGSPKKQAIPGSRTCPPKVAASHDSSDESSSAEESEPADATEAKPQAVRPKKQAIASSRTFRRTTRASDDSVEESKPTEKSRPAVANAAKGRPQAPPEDTAETPRDQPGTLPRNREGSDHTGSQSEVTKETNDTRTASSGTARSVRVQRSEDHEFVDFRYIQSQVSMEQALHHLGHLHKLRGAVQRRGYCPVHDPHGNSDHRSGRRDFSVNLEKNLFQCFYPRCGVKGNVIDFWAAVHNLQPKQAAIHLARTFGVSLRPSEP